ncbi:DUF2388 domain-containing protein [Pseudomonas sp. KHPS1]|nr:DUF2388 domain-containing protein [Pseudomonas sp. KHPS1]UTH36376.1 DUF2388 domain-containing protein [Pseudomonas sp. KHPS1]
MEQVARWPWNAWPDERGLGGRMAWNPHPERFKGVNLEAALRHLRLHYPGKANDELAQAILAWEET